MGLTPGRRAAALGILLAHLLGGCASDRGGPAPVPPPQPPPISIAVDEAAPVAAPVTLDCDAGLLEPWFRRRAETAEGAGTGLLAGSIEFSPVPGRSARLGILEMQPVQRWLEEAAAAGDTDPANGLLAAINTGGAIDLQGVVSPELGDGQALVLRARPQRLEFQGGVGIRYLAAFTDDYVPLTDANLFYLFEGLTRDGRRYVSLRLPLAATALPDAPEPGTLEAAAEFAVITDAYVDAVLERLTLAEPASFRPPLDRLDEFVGSIVVR